MSCKTQNIEKREALTVGGRTMALGRKQPLHLFTPIRCPPPCRISPISSSLLGSPFLSIPTNFSSPSPLCLHLLSLLRRITKSNLASPAHAIKSSKTDQVFVSKKKRLTRCSLSTATHQPCRCGSSVMPWICKTRRPRV